MNVLQELLAELDYKETTDRICGFIADQVAINNARGLIIGVSGGLDSAVGAFLGVKALGPAKVHGLFLSEKGTTSHNRRYAEEVAKTAGFSLETIELTPTLEKLGCYRNLIVRLARSKTLNRIGFQTFRRISNLDLFEINLKGTNNKIVNQAIESYYLRFRTRIEVLCNRAREEGSLRPECFNRTESLVGFSPRYGDIEGDFAPILPLYKTQVRALATYLGVPKAVISKPPSPDMIPGITDEMILNISYNKLDPVLFSLEKGFSEQEISVWCGVPWKQVKRLKHLVALTSHLGQRRGKAPHPDLGK